MPYSRRLFLWLLGYSLLLLGAFVAFQYHREKEFKAGEINAQLQLINNYILTELGDGVNPQDIRLDEFHPFDDLRVSIIAPDGKVHYDNSLDSLPSSNHLDRSEIQQAMLPGTVNTTGEMMFPKDMIIVAGRAGSAYAPVYTAFAEGSPLVVQMDPKETGDMSIYIDCTAVMDTKIVMGSKIAIITNVGG